MAAPTVIDLSLLPPPDAIETLSYEALNSEFITQFKTLWAAVRAAYPSLNLPTYDVDVLETDPLVVISEAWAYVRLNDRARVNDAVRSVLAPLAQKDDLEQIVARVGVERLTITPSPDGGVTPAIMESDEQLLRRYLLAFDRPSAGSADRYKYEALTACPQLQDVRVNGYAIHGRKGDVDIVLAGPGGRLPTTEEVLAVSNACTATNVKPEATGVSVIAAIRALYSVSMTLEIPAGPDPAVIQAMAIESVTAAAQTRLLIGAQVPTDLLFGAAYQPNVLRVNRGTPTADIPPDPYTIPVMSGLNIAMAVQG